MGSHTACTDAAGKTALVMGGNSGIAFESVQARSCRPHWSREGTVASASSACRQDRIGHGREQWHWLRVREAAGKAWREGECTSGAFEEKGFVPIKSCTERRRSEVKLVHFRTAGVPNFCFGKVSTLPLFAYIPLHKCRCTWFPKTG